MGRPSKFSPEFRERAVELVRATDRTIAEVARGLQINDTTLGNWVEADHASGLDPRGGPSHASTSPTSSAPPTSYTTSWDVTASAYIARENVLPK